MRSERMAALDVLVGRWAVTLSNAWFLEPAGTEVHGSATYEWIGDAFVLLRFTSEGYDLVLGRNDPWDSYVALYHDERGVCRQFHMTFGDGRWTLTREDPDFHQRFLATVSDDRIEGRWEASDDGGQTWRKDFDITFVREPDHV